MPRPALLLAFVVAAAPLVAQEGAAVGNAADVIPPAGEAAVVPGDPAGDPSPFLDPVATWEAVPGALLDAEGVDLDAFEYVARPLVIFADSPRQPQLAEQLRLIEGEAAGLLARDVAVIVDSDPAARSAVRLALRPRGFGIVLIDKDGRVTLRRPAPLSVREIARAIDKTPIRQEEIRAAEGREP